MQTSKAFFAKIQGWGTKVTWQNYYDWWDLVALLWSQNQKRFLYMGTSGFSSTKESNGSKKQRKIFTNQHEMTITHAVTFDQTVNVSYVSQGNILQAICHIEYNNNSTSVFQWTLHFSSRHIVNLLSDKKNISSIVIVQNEAKV